MLKRICFFMLLLAAAGISAQPLESHELDKSSSRRLVLDNKLKVLLVSDPGFNRAAAALDVEAGSLLDPKKRQGLAHFLEHMLFLGTKKYPDVEAFSQYLKQQGGYSNAFTADDHTNYHFEVNHEALDGALDRFSQFFIDPLFTPEFIDRERNAVQSEHKKNLMNDSWREYQLMRMHMRPDHPANHFSTGSEKTLEGVERDEFTSFYRNYYSANLMSLVILSNKSLDELEDMARKHFSTVPNHDLKAPVYAAAPLARDEAFRVISYEPIKELRELSLVFSLPGTRQWWSGKPGELVAHCLGHEGEGSLLSWLKERGWATGLSSGANDETGQYGSFSVGVSLTEEGLKNYKEIVRAVFSYLDIVRRDGIPQYLFDESAQLAALNYAWTDKGEGTHRAVMLAELLNNYPEEDPLTLPFRYETFRPEWVKSILGQLTPDNMLCIIAAQGVKTDAVEPYYGTKYSLTRETGDFYDSLLKAPAIPELHLPKPNRFISTSQNVLSDRPILLVNEPGARLYYLQDTEFRRPKTSISMRFRLPTANASARTAALAAFYGAVLEEQLNELAYPAREAGVGYTLSGSHEGLSFGVSGYSDSALTLLAEITPQLRKITLSQARFDDIREEILRGWRNFDQDAAWQIARQTTREIRREINFMPSEMLAAAQDITFADVKGFPALLFACTHVEGMIHGNITAEKATAVFNEVRQSVQALPAAAADCFDDRVMAQPAGELFTYMDKLQTNNSCFWRMLALGGDTAQLRAAARVIDNFMSQPFYTEMRTKQQLGYIVWAVATADAGEQYLAYIIQSGDYPADELRKRADAFIATLPDQLDALTDADFESIRSGVRKELLEKPRDIQEKAKLLETLAFEREGDFERIRATVEAVDHLTKAEVAAIFRRALEPATRRGYDVLSFAAQHESAAGVTSAADLAAFRKGRSFAKNPKD